MPDFDKGLHIEKVDVHNYLCSVDKETLDEIGVKTVDLFTGSNIENLSDLFNFILEKIVTKYCETEISSVSFSPIPSKKGNCVLDIIISPSKYCKNYERGAYCFENIGSVIAFCNAIARYQIRKSSLLKSEGNYILCIDTEYNSQIDMIACEFICSDPNKCRTYYMEHGEVLVKENAVRSLCF